MVRRSTRGGKSGASKAGVVADAMPGWKVVDPDEAKSRRRLQLGETTHADAISASLAGMKRKYSRTAMMDAPPAPDAAAEADGDRTTQVVTVEAPGGQRKTVGVRGNKITWRQG